MGRFDESSEPVTRSYRKLRAAEKELAKGLKIRLLTAGPGTRFAELASTVPIPRYAEPQLRLRIGLYHDAEPRAGQIIKMLR